MDSANKLEHLPESKQTEIQKALDIILEVANPEKVILFGSYAKGTWVDDITVEDGVTFTYHSDFDFLVVIKDNSEKEYTLKSKIENKSSSTVKGIVSVLVHNIDYINEGLFYGQYFFKQIIEEGISLYDTQNSSFVSPTEFSSQVLKDRAQEYFDIWFPMACEFFIDGKAAFKRNSLRVSNFHLHQSVEHFYATVLLVFTGYKPKSHNLQNLRDYSKNISLDLFSLFLDPNDPDSETQIFKILKKGYVDARYKKEYPISSSEINQIIIKVEEVKTLVESLCKSELKRLENSI